MSVLSVLRTKPWETVGADPVDKLSAASRQRIYTKSGLIAFLCIASMLFSIVVIAYLLRQDQGDWRPLSQQWLLWLNTLMLVLSSAALHRAWVASRHENDNHVRLMIALAGLFTVLFLLGQARVWQTLNALGYFVADNPANTFFYMITALHGLHVLGGLVAWARTAIKLFQGTTSAQAHSSIELCVIYWHFMLAVWLVLFAMMSLT